MAELGPVNQFRVSGSGALAMTPAYLIVDGSSDILIDDTGPAEAYFNSVGGDIEVSTTPASQQRTLLKAGGDYHLI